MTNRTIFPFSLHQLHDCRTTSSHRPRFSFSPENYSIEVDDHDETFKSSLRRKSFTGETPHPVLRQLSEAKVSIPVQHVEDDEELDLYENGKRMGTAVHTSQTTQVEKIPLINYARKQEDGTASSQCPSQKLEPLAQRTRLPISLQDDAFGRNGEGVNSNYDRDRYEDHWSNQCNVDNCEKFRDEYDGEINKEVGKALQQLSMQCHTRKESAKRSRHEEHEAEIRKQDEFMKKQYNLFRFFIIPDGNCLYRAVAQATLGDQSQHHLLRQLTVEHIREHKVEFKDIIEGDIDVFLSAAQLEGEWAGYPEVLALSRLLEININITTGGTTSNPNVHTRLHYFAPTDSSDKVRHLTTKDKAKCTERESIWVSWLSNGHYDCFTDKLMENPHYEKYLESKESRIRSDAAMATQIHLDETNQALEPIYNKDDDLNTIDKNNSPKTLHRTHDNVNDWYTATLDAEYKSSVHDLSSRSSPTSNFDRVTTPPPELRRYPQTASRINHPEGSSGIVEPSTISSLPTSTEYDEEIARSLQKEEDDLAWWI